MLGPSLMAVAVPLFLGLASAHVRRTQAWSATASHIWGSCDSHWHWNDKDGSYLGAAGNVTSCLFVDNSTCSDHLSDGPADADVEVVLAWLPPSTAEQDVHLAWWGSFKSIRSYDTPSSPHGCSIYTDMGKAYPKYWEDGFNGGNVRVTERGTAVIRFRAPSAYFFRPYLALPHVHFRVCKGGASAQFYYDSLVVGVDGLRVNTKSQDIPIMILSASKLSGSDSAQYEIPETNLWLAIVSERDDPEATMTTSATPDMMEVMMDAAKETLILDALEFSPVYQCLLQETVFNHFSGTCAEECPDDAELHHGQCVLPAEGDATEIILIASWQLEVHCETLCGESMENEKLHNLRLSVAGHLDIPFQEVEQVALTWLEQADRRLVGDERTAFLSVKVVTKRYEEGPGFELLTAFLHNAGEASQLLGIEVEEVASLPEDTTIANGPSWLLTSESDPFAVAYEALVLDGEGDGAGKSTESGGWLSPGWIAALVGAAVAAGLCGGALLWALRQRAGRRQAVVVEGKAVEVAQDAESERSVEPEPEAAVGTQGGKIVV